MRQQVAERLSQARPNLPDGADPQMGPVSTGLGEIFMYSVEYAHPDGKGADVKEGEPGWQRDGSFLTDEGERLTDDIARFAIASSRSTRAHLSHTRPFAKARAVCTLRSCLERTR